MEISKVLNFVVANPYPGLRAFRPEESHLFFGRDDQIDKLIERLKASHFVAVVGPSGCGKSSLVKAGLIPTLKTGFFLNVGTEWRIIEMRPGEKPYSNLATALDNAFDQNNALGFLVAILKRSPKGLTEALKYYEFKEGENVLLIVDQFEELFRYKQNNNIEEVTAFINLLIASSLQRNISLHVVITMRSDFLGECSLFPGLPEILNDNQFLTPRLTREQTKEAIEGPAKVCGGGLEPQVVTMLLNDIGIEHDQLPILQHALMRMWNVASEKTPHTPLIDSTDYVAIGKLTNALTQHANTAYEKLDKRQEKIARIMFKRLTERNLHLKDVRRPSQIEEIASVAKVHADDIIEVANVFITAEYNFIVSSDANLNGQSFLDISHESIMRQWDKLDVWITEEFESATFYKRLLFDAENHYLGEGELLWGINLENALKWKHKQKPTNTWAARYSNSDSAGKYETVHQFLCDSLKEEKLEFKKTLEKQEQDKKNKEVERENKEIKIRNRRNLLVSICVFLFVVAVVFLLLLGKNNNLYKAFELNALALSAVDHDPTLALRFEELALKKSPQNKIINTSAEKILSENAFYRTIVADSTESFSCLDVSKNGNLFLTGSSKNNLVFLWREDGSKKILDVKKPVIIVAFSPNADRFLTVSLDKTVTIWDTAGKKIKILAAHKDQITTAIYSNNGRYILTGSQDSSAILWNSEGDSLNTFREMGQSKVITIAFSPNDSKILTGSLDDTARLWSVNGHDLLYKYANQNSRNLRRVAFSSDSTSGIVLTASADGGVILWATSRDDRYKDIESNKNFDPSSSRKTDSLNHGINKEKENIRFPRTKKNRWGRNNGIEKKGKMIGGFSAHQSEINSLSFSSDGTQILTGSSDNTAKLWNLYGTLIQEYKGHKKRVTYVKFDATGKKAYTGSADGTIKIWHTDNKLEKEFIRYGNEVRTCASSADGSVIAISSNDSIFVYSILKKEFLVKRFPTIYKKVNCIALSPDGKRLLVASDSTKLEVWNVDSVSLTTTINNEHKGAINAVTFSTDGNKILTGCEDSTARIFGTNGKLIGEFRDSTQTNVLCVAFSPDGTKILTGSKDSAARIWNVGDGNKRPLHTYKVEDQLSVISVAFSSDGKKIITACGDQYARIWNLQKDSIEKAFDCSTDYISYVTFSQGDPNQYKFLTGSGDGNIGIWDLQGKLKKEFKRQKGTINYILLSRDETRIISSSSGNSVRLWNNINKFIHPKDFLKSNNLDNKEKEIRDLTNKN